MIMDLTIFTPTFNRANQLKRTFNSLQKQTNKDFCWIIVDDGSTDNTKEVVESFKNESTFPIYYDYQYNQGKPFAFNRGVELCKTPYFFCIDSDDWLTEDAVEKVKAVIEKKEVKSHCSGFVFQCAYENGKTITSKDFPDSPWQGTFQELLHVAKILGDTAIVYDTNEIKNNLFPKFGTEKFVPEALVLNRMGIKAPFHFYNEKIQFKEYLDEGFSANMSVLFKKNPMGYYVYCLEALDFKQLSIKERIRHIAAVGVFGKKIKKKYSESLKNLRGMDKITFILLFPAIMLYKI